MPDFIKRYVRFVDTFNRRVGLFAMYLIFAMFAILLYSSVSKAFHLPASWTLESAQFTMAAYYMLGGAFAMQTGDHVRMDLFYTTWSARKRAIFDTVTAMKRLRVAVPFLARNLNFGHHLVKEVGHAKSPAEGRAIIARCYAEGLN